MCRTLEIDTYVCYLRMCTLVACKPITDLAPAAGSCVVPQNPPHSNTHKTQILLHTRTSIYYIHMHSVAAFFSMLKSESHLRTPPYESNYVVGLNA